VTDTPRGKDWDRLLKTVAKLVRKEDVSAAERDALEAALRPVVRSVVAKTVWRRDLSFAAHRAKLEDAVQESWVIIMGEILRDFDPERGSLFAFVRRCLRRRLLSWLEREQAKRFHLLADPNGVPDNRTVASECPARTDELKALVEQALRAASFRDKAIFWLRMRGASYATIASEMGMKVVAARGVMFRLLSHIRALNERADA
jgi:RNA polymerase sigma factor (sigma-70 family)